jgi:23S rRNA (uracil1939-C5)-methyltransferase
VRRTRSGAERTIADMTVPGEWLRVESLDLEGQGVAHDGQGKVVFIDGALPGEEVQVQVHRRKNQWEQGTLTALRHESSQRVRPACSHFGLHAGACGGCRMQHLHVSAQVAVKQRALEDSLWHIAKVRPARLLRPIEGPSWGYRYRARLSVRHVAKKGGVLVGFHERKSSYVADMTSCAVLPPQVSALLPALRALIGGLPSRDRLPQIELAAGDDVTVLVLRHLQPLSGDELAALRGFAGAHAVQWWLQPQGPASAHPLDAHATGLSYALPEYGVRIAFRPTDFTQVNPHINRVLVDRAVRLLAAQPGERVIDWFCGLGNFTLPMARCGAQVMGLEGSAELVERARDNARANGLEARTRFEVRNLFEMDPDGLNGCGRADRWLVDPPREGAFALSKALVDLRSTSPGHEAAPRRIVYVSCNPATLARDAGLLVHQGGYACTAAGVVNMFPHTAHVESIAVFDRA